MYNILLPVNNQKGVSAVIVAIVLSMLLGFVALAIDIGYLYATRNQLQNTADASALAATGELGRIYSTMTFSQQELYNANSDGDGNSINDVTQIKQESIDAGAKNKAAGKSIIIDPNDIIITVWDWNLGADQALVENFSKPDAVRVTARRDSTLNGAVVTFFSKILSVFGGSHDTFQLSAVATAALSGPSSMDEGELITPFGISKNNFPSNCGQLITFKDTKDSCAGWHNFFDSHDNNSIRNKAYDIIAGNGGAAWLNDWFGISGTPTTTPEANVEDEFDFSGGVKSAMTGIHIDWTLATPAVTGNGQVAPFPALFDYFRFRDGDGNDNVWTAKVPVYEDNIVCDNPSGLTKIVGFAIIEIRGWKGPPDNTINVYIDCNRVVIGEGRGGGGSFGNLLGSIPNLVQ